jgi:tetratricopeptide (TPR) repeat protein
MSDSLRCPARENTDQVQRYVAGTLSPDEVEAFEVHLLECTHCQQEVREGATIRAALIERREEGGGARRRRIFVPALSFATAAAIAMWLLLPFGNGLEQMGRVDSVPSLVPLPVRASADSMVHLADRGMEAYQQGEYREAAELLGDAAAADSGPGLHFFLGIAQLMSESPREATASLMSALEPEGNPYTAEAHLYLAKAWLQMGRADSSLLHLAAVPTHPDEIHAHAQALADSVRQIIR